MKLKRIISTFAVMLVLGVLAGSVLRVRFPQLPVWEMPVLSYGMHVSRDAFLPVFRETAIWSVLWLAAFAMTGLTLLAVPGVLMLWLLLGVRVGAVLGAMYSEVHLLGFVIAAGFMIPYVLASAALFLVASREALRSGICLMKAVRGRGAERLSFRAYALRYLVLGAGMLLLALLHGFWMGWLLPLLI